MIDPHAPPSMPLEAIVAAILRAVAARGRDKSVCPSEVARALDPVDWRALMPAVRTAASALAQAGRIRITQGGRRLDGPWRGPIRLRLP
jgi:hypothetical protein